MSAINLHTSSSAQAVHSESTADPIPKYYAVCGILFTGTLLMSEASEWLVRVAALLVAGAVAAWTAWACRRAQQHGLPASDALVWVGVSGVFLGLAVLKMARELGIFSGWGAYLRFLARDYHVYADRRTFQVIVTVAVALAAVVLLLYGLVWFWDSIKRYRLAIGLTAVVLGYVAIRFVSLHEVDAWNSAHPWVRTYVDLIAASGTSAIAIARLRQLGELEGTSG
jgi:hypothetical protein